MKYVYILQSLDDPPTFYTGLTDDLPARLSKHNRRRSSPCL
jgi:predicted GIY-YIG superfamily endonuclease